MKTPLFLLTFVMMLMLAPVSELSAAQSGSTPAKRTITIRKYPRNINDSKEGIRLPSEVICCTVSRENGIQPIDTSDIESYEVWESDDTAPMVIFEDESHFIDYILDMNPEGIIKLYTPEYVYVGFMEFTQAP